MSKTVKINGKWPLVLPDSSADEWLGNMKYHHNSWEMPRLLKLEQMIKSGKKNVLYIGAYKGDMAALLASWGANVLMVESTPAFWGLIKETWDLNPDLPKPAGCFSGLASRETKNVTPESVGVNGDFPARVAEYIEGAVGFTHLAESKDDVSFPQMSIDGMCLQFNFYPDIITMDIEGSELEAAYGGLSQIVDNKPAWLISVHPEFMFHNHGTYERELHDLLRNNKYIGEWLDYDHEHHWLYEYKGEK